MDAVSARRRREFDAARARLRDRAIREDRDTSRETGAHAPAEPAGEADRDRAPLDQPPERVRKQSLRAGNQLFLKQAPHQLAFEDLGPYLVTGHNRPDVVGSMIDTAHARSRQRIRVSGHEAFRSDVWRQATLPGIEAGGYEPKAAGLARLADAWQARLDSRIGVAADVAVTATSGTRGRNDARRAAAIAPSVDAGAGGNEASPPAPEHDAASQPRSAAAGRNAANDDPGTAQRYVGELREPGRVPYLHNPARSDSYYVAFRDEAGIGQAVWSVDPERATRESGAGIAQQVTPESLGRRLVTVRVPVLDGEGKVTGEEDKDVYWNTCQVEAVQRDRTAPTSPPQPVSPADSEARSAHARAPSLVKEESRRRNAQRPDSGQALHLAVLAAVMREQGFSECSIARVQQRAARMLVAFGREGVSVPTPKVFDPEAPSGRDRRRRPAPGREPVRKMDRIPVEPPPMSASR
jgi:hypothetical protein